MRAPIEARYLARRQVFPTVWLAVVATFFVVLWLLDRSSWCLLFGVLEFLAFAAFGVVVSVRMRQSGWVLRLDESGITIRGAEPVAWADLTHVVLGPIRPMPAFTTTKWTQILAFVPREGVQLPGPPHYRGHPQRWGHSIRQRFYGTNLTMLPHAMSVTAEELITASIEWGDLEIQRSRQLHPLAAAALAVLTCALAGAVVGLVVSLF